MAFSGCAVTPFAYINPGSVILTSNELQGRQLERSDEYPLRLKQVKVFLRNHTSPFTIYVFCGLIVKSIKSEKTKVYKHSKISFSSNVYSHHNKLQWNHFLKRWWWWFSLFIHVQRLSCPYMKLCLITRGRALFLQTLFIKLLASHHLMNINFFTVFFKQKVLGCTF